LFPAVGAGPAAGQQAGQTTAISPDERAIYETVLTAWLEPNHGRQYVNARLSPPPVASSPDYADCVKGVRFETAAGEPPPEKILPSAAFRLPHIELIDGERWRARDPENAIARGKSIGSAVGEGFSGSLISLSQISFSVDRRDALVSFGMACGRLCGTGFTLLLHRTAAEWSIVTRCGQYMS
jgi:hypothetical protein